MKISQDENFVNTSKKTPEKQKLKISRCALGLKLGFVSNIFSPIDHDYLWK